MAAQLGQTTDPRALIPGNPEAVLNAADTLVQRGERLESIGQGLGRIETPDWTGEASGAFWDKFSGEKPKWLRGSDAMSAAANALGGHADTLTWAQTQAQEAIDLWERGEAATKQAAGQHNAAVDRANAQVHAGHPAPDIPPFSDPGAKLRQQAQDILNRAREQLVDAGARTADTISNHAGNGPDSPGWLAKAADVTDAAVNEHGLGSTTVDWSRGQDGPVQLGDDKGGPSWEVKLAELSGEANLWEVGAAGETQLAGATLEGSAALKTLGAEGSAAFSVSGDGLKAGASGSAYLAKVMAEGSAQWGIVGANAKGQAYVGASANAEATIGRDGVNLSAGAFAGARAEGSVGADVAGLGAGVSGEAWAGVGVEADATVGMQDGKFTIGGEFGAGLGVGGKLGFEVTVDPGEVAETVGDAADAVGDAAGDAADAVGDAAGAAWDNTLGSL